MIPSTSSEQVVTLIGFYHVLHSLILLSVEADSCANTGHFSPEKNVPASKT